MPGMPSRQAYANTLKSNLVAFAIPLVSAPTEANYSRWKNKAQTEATAWAALAASKGAWAKTVNSVGAEKCMVGIMSKKRKQKLGRERKRREMPVDALPNCAVCGKFDTTDQPGQKTWYSAMAAPCVSTLCALAQKSQRPGETIRIFASTAQRQESTSTPRPSKLRKARH